MRTRLFAYLTAFGQFPGRGYDLLLYAIDKRQHRSHFVQDQELLPR